MIAQISEELPYNSEKHSMCAELLPPATIRYQYDAQDEFTRQFLIFESAPSFSNPSQGKGTALVELADGRLFFFRTSLGAMKDGVESSSLVHELCRLPMWITDWNGTANFVGYIIGTSLAFIGKDFSMVENWNIPEWKQHAISWLAINQPKVTPKQINELLSAVAEELTSDLSNKLGLFMGNLDQYACSMQGKTD